MQITANARRIPAGAFCIVPCLVHSLCYAVSNMNDMEDMKMKNYFNAALHSELTPSDCIRAMQADTCDGILNFPKWDADEDCTDYYVCKVNWNADDAEKVVAEYEQLRASLAEIAGCYSIEDNWQEKNAAVQADPWLSALWDVYIRPFETEAFDDDRILEIEEKMEDSDMSEDERREIGLTDFEAPTAEELEYYDRYCAAIFADCAKRLSGSVCTYETVIRAKRLTRLMILSAPQFILDHEASMLAAAMALRAYCTEMELTEG